MRCQVRVTETYSEAKRQFSDRNRDIIIIIIIKSGRQCKAEGESGIHPISPKTPAP